jgi:hypothetical protein
MLQRLHQTHILNAFINGAQQMIWHQGSSHTIGPGECS